MLDNILLEPDTVIAESEVPLIYTSKGNLPIDSLEYLHYWTEDEDAIFFNEEYRLDGEIVKSNRHGRMKHGLSIEAETAEFS